MMVGGDRRDQVVQVEEPEDDGGWNTGETRWYRWRNLRPEDDGGWNTVRRDQVVQVEGT